MLLNPNLIISQGSSRATLILHRLLSQDGTTVAVTAEAGMVAVAEAGTAAAAVAEAAGMVAAEAVEAAEAEVAVAAPEVVAADADNHSNKLHLI